jgi:hypothetical protein
MASKASRSPSHVLVANALATWRVAIGCPADGCVYPAGVDTSDFTEMVKWAKAQ